jgi:hypothetical protein
MRRRALLGMGTSIQLRNTFSGMISIPQQDLSVDAS